MFGIVFGLLVEYKYFCISKCKMILKGILLELEWLLRKIGVRWLYILKIIYVGFINGWFKNIL